MTLFIATILLYQFGFSWPWYIAMAILWLLHITVHDATDLEA